MSRWFIQLLAVAVVLAQVAMTIWPAGSLCLGCGNSCEMTRADSARVSAEPEKGDTCCCCHKHAVLVEVVGECGRCVKVDTQPTVRDGSNWDLGSKLDRLAGVVAVFVSTPRVEWHQSRVIAPVALACAPPGIVELRTTRLVL